MVKYTIGDALQKGIALLKQSNIPGAATDAAVLLAHVLECTRLCLTVHRHDCLPEDKVQTFLEMVSRRCKREPVSYITGKKEFMSLDFAVEKGILIPRPDTEILVELVMEKLKGISNPRIIDMCTGSGAVAVSLAKYIAGSRVAALDISDTALSVSAHNAKTNGVDIEVIRHDVLTPYTDMADAVVSNPPYIPTETVATLDADVAQYEPHLALDGGKDGLVFYRAIVAGIRSSLKPGGLLAFEVGCGQAQDVSRIMEPYFEDIGTERDLAGIERVVYGVLRK